MERLTQKQRRDLIVQYKLNDPSVTNYSIAKYLKPLGISKSTIYSVLQTYAERGTTKRSSGSGRIPIKMPYTRVRTLVNSATTSQSFTQRVVARKYGISQQFVCKILHSKGIRSYKKEKMSKVSEKQVTIQKLRIDRLYRLILSKKPEPLFILDDESYFTFSGSNMPQNDHYYSTKRRFTENCMKYRYQAKFERKVMCWIAISARGISKPYFCLSHEAVNAEIYQRKCIRQRLIPFLNSHHQDNNYLFWPDLASCHYARSTMAVFKDMNIQVVPKDMNPPNCPQLRPIEDFWGILKQLVYAKGWEATTHIQLQRRIRYCLRKVDVQTVQKMMSSVKSKIRRARASGVETMVH